MNLCRVRGGIAAGWLAFLTIFLVACGGSGSTTTISPAPPPLAPTAPTVTSFTASSLGIALGQSTTLKWQESGATTLQLDGMAVLLSASSMIVVPAETTTYTLTATNAVGSMQQSATVTVTPASPIASVQIKPTAATQPIPTNFLGIGQNMGDTLSMVGTSASNINPIYEQLLRNLIQYANAPLLIRESAQGSSGASPDVYDAPRLAALGQLTTDLGAHFTVGVDFLDDDVATATGQVQQLVAGLPSSAFDAIELGSEPDLYGVNGERPVGWDYGDYLTDYDNFAPAILAVSGGVKLEAPVFAGLSLSFMSNLNSFVTTQASQLALVTVHHYSGNGCNGPIQPADYLLSEIAVDGDTQPLTGPVDIPQYITAARQAGIPFRIGELNSINCGGQAGVSNSFSSALWGMDIAFSYANVGVSGVNFFAPADPNTTSYYTPFDFNFTESNGTRSYTVRNINPLYYGLLLFAQTVQNKAQLLPVTLTTQANIKTWATIDGNGAIRLLILNKDEIASGPVSIALIGYGQAVVTRLLAPSYSSVTGITLGGQTFDGTPDGTPQGVAYEDTVQPIAGTYTVAVPAVSAALITIHP